MSQYIIEIFNLFVIVNSATVDIEEYDNYSINENKKNQESSIAKGNKSFRPVVVPHTSWFADDDELNEINFAIMLSDIDEKSLQNSWFARNYNI